MEAVQCANNHGSSEALSGQKAKSFNVRMFKQEVEEVLFQGVKQFRR